MAIANSGILEMIKVYYAKAGVANLLYRNDDLLKKLGNSASRIEGKSANFSALYSRGGAVSADATVAVSLANVTAQAKEFAVTPGQLFSACVYNNKEVLASKSMAGAYVPIATAKMFAALESFRKTLAVALYGSGHGELFTLGDDFTAMVVGTDIEQTWPTSAIFGVDIGSEVVYKATVDALDSAAVAAGKVVAVDPTAGKVTIRPSIAGTPLTGHVVCIKGCTDSDGKPMLPVGLGGWLPNKDIPASDNFFGVNRSAARERLAGVRYAPTATEPKYLSIEKALLAVQSYGSNADMIVMNTSDVLELQQEVEGKTQFLKAPGQKGKLNVGVDGIGIGIIGTFLDKIISSPYCPKGTAYVLDSETVKLWTYSNADKVDDKAAEFKAIKEVEGGENVSDKPYQMLVDDIFTLNPSSITSDGAGTLVLVNFYGEFVVTDPSKNAVIQFK